MLFGGLFSQNEKKEEKKTYSLRYNSAKTFLFTSSYRGGRFTQRVTAGMVNTHFQAAVRPASCFSFCFDECLHGSVCSQQRRVYLLKMCELSPLLVVVNFLNRYEKRLLPR